MLNLANKRYIEKVTVSLIMIKISPTFICISAMEKKVIWGIALSCLFVEVFFFILLKNFFSSFITRTCRESERGHYDRTWSLTMAGYTTLLFIFFVIQTICQGKELSVYNMPSSLPLKSPTFPPQILPSFAPLFILFCSHQVPCMVYSLFSSIR